MIGVGMLLIQVMLGGITRLTGSGLSITEWDVITGVVPPLNHHQWVVEFDKYRQSPQYHWLNADFTLSDFKSIFFWEWFHRFWARMIGVVFIVGFVYLVAKKYLRKEMYNPLLILFLLGALQGAIGWIMVASGLTGDAIYVKPTRLALHFVFALGLISYAYWFALQLLVPDRDRLFNPGLRKWTLSLLPILFLQLIYGALMAGHRAATAAPTWPDINGSLIPGNLFREHPLWLNFLENKVTIHFIHRGIAYLLLTLITIYSFRTFRLAPVSRTFRKARLFPLALVWLQVCLGIFTVLTSTHIVPNRWGIFEWIAELHQVTAMLLLLSLVTMLYLLRPAGRTTTA